MLFQYDQIHSLNKKEFDIYNYVSNHISETADMSIRELASMTGVSTSTILRFCSKVGFESFAQFRYEIRKLQKEQKENKTQLLNPIPAVQYLKQAVKDPHLEQKIKEVAALCINAEQVIWIGSGANGSIAEYGAHFFASVGIQTSIIKDVFFPLPAKSAQNKVLIVLSVSGENPHMIVQIDGYKKKKAKVISITNTDQSTIANMSDINFSYFIPLSNPVTSTGEAICLVSQIPVVYLIEALTNRIYKEQNAQN